MSERGKFMSYPRPSVMLYDVGIWGSNFLFFIQPVRSWYDLGCCLSQFIHANMSMVSFKRFRLSLVKAGAFWFWYPSLSFFWPVWRSDRSSFHILFSFLFQPIKRKHL